ncbi:dicarboxylate/amino acid:cation symporter [Pseudoramibacter porci]|uniref:Dicarboxylate/amino acid:cation symporter n=1 Tax=Pseudoramibacter porci TaxID=2606631 RepID=A0A7X2T9P3_9FIRM|nr:dicarboxylate/amino acid:cation symporter [Pseudoramibacter porci]MSS19255.1 dicarboxylate/amino acid:cation symporter [Pseudoramibacter porci]
MATSQKSKRKLSLLPRLLIGIAAGILIGSLGNILHIAHTPGFTGLIRVIATFVALFSEFLNFTIPLLILAFVSVGLAELGKKANKLFGITLALAYCSTIIAGFSAYFLGSTLLPKLVRKIGGSVITGKSFDPIFTISMKPVFPIMTSLILAFVLGLAMANLETPTLMNAVQDLKKVIVVVLEKVIIPLIPYYIAGTFAKIAAAGQLAPTIIMFAKLYICILCLQWVYILFQFTVASGWRRENRWKDLKNIVPAYFTALGTQSSAATIPVSLQSAADNGIAPDVRNFVIPLCATIHLAGDTICLTLGSMGIMLACGLHPTLNLFAPFIFMLGITMVAAPGVPGGGVMAALGIIKSMLGFTSSMCELIIALHLSQDSFGTACNITGDQSVAAIVDYIDSKDRESEPRISAPSEKTEEAE